MRKVSATNQFHMIVAARRLMSHALNVALAQSLPMHEGPSIPEPFSQKRANSSSRQIIEPLRDTNAEYLTIGWAETSY